MGYQLSGPLPFVGSAPAHVADVFFAIFSSHCWVNVSLWPQVQAEDRNKKQVADETLCTVSFMNDILSRHTVSSTSMLAAQLFTWCVSSRRELAETQQCPVCTRPSVVNLH